MGDGADDGQSEAMVVVDAGAVESLSSLSAMVEPIDGGVAADPVSLQRCAANLRRPVVPVWHSAGNTFAARFVLGG